jgi:hypothetical protein
MTDDSAAFQNLMAQVGPTLELARVTAYADDNACSLVFDDDAGRTIDAEWNASTESVVLTAEVTTVPTAARARAFEVLLQYNYLWSEHGGVRTALANASGDVVLLFDLPLAGLDLARLCEVLTNLNAIAASCRTVLAAVAEASGGADGLGRGGDFGGTPEQGNSAFSPLMIRV